MAFHCIHFQVIQIVFSRPQSAWEVNSESPVSVWVKDRPVAVETEPVHGAAGAERQRVTRLVDDTSESVGARDSGQTVLWTMATMDQVG